MGTVLYWRHLQIHFCEVDVKVLIGILNRPWLIEPGAAQHWAGIAHKVIYQGASFSAPTLDKRKFYTDDYYNTDLGDAFRIHPDGRVDNKAGSIQVLKVMGPIMKNDYCGAPGTQTIGQLFNAALADDTIIGTILWTDSPGGQVDGTENLANAIKGSSKPVICFAENMICSAAYWIGSSASEIIVDGSNNGWNSTIGSIGTMCAWEDDTEQMAKEGRKLITVFADASSDKWGDHFAAQKGDFTRMKQQLNGINDTFLSAIQGNRSGKLSASENVLTGKTYNAKEALKYGLIDKIGSFSDAVKRVAALAKGTQKVKTTSMSTKNFSFQQALAAAKASEFTVAEEGFLLTEDQLNNIEAVLDQQTTIASATAAQLKTLQAQSAAFEANTTAVADLATAQAALEAANVKITGLQAQVDEAATKPGGFFKTPGATDAEDPAGAGEDDEMNVINNLPHNKEADRILNR